ncbi:MAG: zf-HC2 domain-containing protein [Planctomycetales bacterium]|nr:zf-HC2 domain-containing protein [Planctomycetales bacterium]
MMLACREMTELTTDYLERQLSWWDRMRFLMHIGMCGACWEYVRGMKAVLANFHRIGTEVVPPEVPPELFDRFRNWKR